MLGYLPKRAIIFFIPGMPGNVFALPAKKCITVHQLSQTQESLVQVSNNPVVYIEDRRVKSRS